MQYPSHLPLLTTLRLTIRLAQPTDTATLCQFEIDNLEHLTPWEPEKTDNFFTLSYWKWRIDQSLWLFEHNKTIRFIVFHKDTGVMIGIINFFDMTRGAFYSCRLGYKIDYRYEGKGYMTESLRAAIRYMFQERNLHRISASYMPANERSKRLLNTLGFTEEGFAKQYLHINGEWEDHVLTALLNPDWKKPQELPALPVKETIWHRLKNFLRLKVLEQFDSNS